MANSASGNCSRGFGLIGVIVVTAAVAILAGGGYFAYQRFAKPADTGRTACTQEAKLCPNGSSVSRAGPNCEFAACPEEKINGQQYDPKKFCKINSDCVLFSCSGAFNAEWAKTAPPDLPCLTYLGYTPQCIAQVCTAVKEVDTSTWKTYRNEQYGFEVRYPSELSTEFRLYDNYGFQLIFNAQAEKSVIAIELVDARSTNFLKFIESQKESVKQSKIFVDGIAADFYEGLREFTTYNVVTLVRGDDLIAIYQYSVDKPFFNKILSTFKFIPSTGSGQAK